MKIGEVLKKTGLTDRAVRLYIEHGLVAPYVEKSYSGRKSIAFTEEDVEKLRRISILRKADFSIAQIEMIAAGGEGAVEAFSEFMNTKREKHAADAEVLNALDNFTETVSLENVAKALENGGADKMENIDIVPTKEEIREKRGYTVLGIVMTAGSSLWLLFVLLISMGMFYGFYRYPKIDWGMFIIHLLVAIPNIIGLSCGIDIIKRYRTYISDIDAKWSRRGNALGGVAIAVALWMLSAPVQFIFSGFIPFVYSETTDVDDYLAFDRGPSYYASDSINKIFPARIPVDARGENCTYYYNYANIVESKYEIVAQWSLKAHDYEAEKKRIAYLHPAAPVIQHGDYTCVVVEGMKNGEWGYTSMKILLFAYNDNEKTVRYIVRDDIESLEPYFASLDW